MKDMVLERPALSVWTQKSTSDWKWTVELHTKYDKSTTWMHVSWSSNLPYNIC